MNLPYQVDVLTVDGWRPFAGFAVKIYAEQFHAQLSKAPGHPACRLVILNFPQTAETAPGGGYRG